MPDLDNVVGSCLLAWLAVEALFYVVVMVYLVPRMNQIEPPAKVRQTSPRLVWCGIESICLSYVCSPTFPADTEYYPHVMN